MPDPHVASLLELLSVDRFHSRCGAICRELLDGASARCRAHRADALGVAGERDDRLGQRLFVAGRNDEAGLAVDDDLRQPADVGDDRCTTALGRLEGDEPEAFAARRDDDDGAPLVARRDVRHAAEKRHSVGRGRGEMPFERPRAGQLEGQLRHLAAREWRTRAGARRIP